MTLVQRRVLLVVALVAHVAVLYAPEVPGTGAAGVPGADKLGHVAVFALVVALGTWAGFPARWVVPLALAHAVVSEAVQHTLLPGRSGDPWDVVADVVGVGLGWAGAAALSRRRAARRPSGRAR